MSKLAEALIEQLLNSSNEDKREFGSNIVTLLGGDTSRQVTNLPARRGTADGGLDGRLKVLAIKINKVVTPERVVFEKGAEQEQDAGISVKIQREKFSREQLGGFKLDLERENLYVGIVITATGLSPDVEVEMERLDRDGIYNFVHILIQDILERKDLDEQLEAKGVKFADGELSQKVREGLARFIESGRHRIH